MMIRYDIEDSSEKHVAQHPVLKNRLGVLGIHLDVLPEETFEEHIQELLTQVEPQQIILLDLWSFIRARGKSVYAQTVRSAALVLPTSRTLQRITWFLRKQHIPRHLPFDFVIRLLGALEKKRKSVYVIGSRPGTLATAASNVRGSFPGLQIVGRCAGFYEAEDEENIILAIRKASPTAILAGYGVPGRDKWLHVHRKKFAPGIFIWAGACIEMFSGKKKRTSRELWARGLDFFPEFVRHPWRIYRLFVYLWIAILVLSHKIKKL